MGGHAAGDVASRLAAEIVRRVYFELKGSVPDLLSAALAAANKAILGYGNDHPECAGLGTTCTALAIRDGLLWLAHVGDSRAYLLRAGQLEQLSEDQTLVRKLVRDGMLSEEEAEHSENNNVLLQALGTLPDLNPELWTEGRQLAPDDVLILCSDGLHGLVPSATIGEIAGRLPPFEACQEMIQAALQAGGHDNISVGVFRIATMMPGDRTRPTDGSTRRISSSGNARSGADELPLGSTRQISTLERSL